MDLLEAIAQRPNANEHYHLDQERDWRAKEFLNLGCKNETSIHETLDELLSPLGDRLDLYIQELTNKHGMRLRLPRQGDL